MVEMPTTSPAQKDRLYSNVKNHLELTNLIDNKIQDILNAKYSKAKNRPQENRLSEPPNEQHLPVLTPKKKVTISPNPVNSKSFVNSTNPASPPTSNKITLEIMLFGQDPAPVNPDLVELLNHDSTKLSVKKNGVIK